MIGKNLKRVVITAGTVAIVGTMAAFPVLANAQTGYNGYSASGTTNTTTTTPRYGYGGYGYGGYGYNGGIANNPISQWIVLSSLFAPGYLYGGIL